MRTQLPITLLATALACTLASTAAHARARVFVASYGNDANPCTFGSPCKTFQQAVNVVDAGGEVTAIDSAGFGPISISKAVTITSPDGVEAGIVPTAGGDAIDINAGATDAIVLRGLTLNGAGVAASNGIVFNSGAALTVTNCLVQNFPDTGGNGDFGILIRPTTGTVTFAVTNTMVANNGAIGIYYSPPSGSPDVQGVIDRVVATGNGYGIAIFPVATSGGSLTATISNSIANNNTKSGIFAQSGPGPFKLTIDNMNSSSNGTGVLGTAHANVLLSRSVVTGNGTGIDNSTSQNTFYTYGNNLIDFNTTNITSPLNTTHALQ